MRKRRCVGALAVICWWLERKAEGTAYMAKDLLEAFGYGNDDSQVVAGCLASFGYTKLTDFFNYLETTSDRLPPPYSSVGRKWWMEKCKKDADLAPKCVRGFVL